MVEYSYNTSLVTIAIGIACLTVLIYSQFCKKSLPAPLPPGPRGLPLVGNTVDLPSSQPWKTFSKWGETYGPITHVNALGKSIIILNDPKFSVDMLTKKSRIYSGRPELIMGGHLVGYDKSRALINFGSMGWTIYRRLFAQFMGTRSKIEPYEHVLQDEATVFLKRLLTNPTAWIKHTYMFAGGIVLMLTYGYKLLDESDEMLKLINEAMDQFSETTTSNAFLVDILPILQYVPEWVPGAGWKKKVPKYKKTLKDVMDLPYEWTKKQMAVGMERSSFLSNILSETPPTPENEMFIKWAGIGIYGGGADTTVAGIEAFFLAMTIQTSAQQKAQAEIDSIIGTNRLPIFADRARLPYMEGVYLEVLRMYTFGPLGLPHVATEEDVHEGYFIPKGSILFSNIWQYFKDPNIYKNPELFNPERFISSDGHAAEKDPREYLFGFGRRACPGQHLGDASMWILCTSLLAAFEIRPPVKDGKLVIPPGNFMDGSISHPEPFETVIKPRSEAVVEMLTSL